MNGVGIVTGAARGIGLAIAQRVEGAGLRVAAVDLDGAALEAAALPASVLRIARDISDDPDQWVREVVDRLGPPTLLVNNAATMDGRSFLELPMEAAERSIRTTLLGTWGVTRAVALQMIEHQVGGAIVFTLSLHATRVRMCPDYSVAKAGLLMLVQELAVELAPHGIRVNAVSPGAVDTWSGGVPDGGELQRRSEAAIPLGRLGDPEDIAKAVEFLADTEKSGYITGANLKVDGGLDQFNWLHHLFGSAAGERERTGGGEP